MQIQIVGAARTMSSREIAELTEKEHFNVLADIRRMLEDLGITALSFQGSYQDSTGRTLPLFNLPKREALILVSGYSVQMRARIIDRWQELEAGAPAAPRELSRLEVLQLALESEHRAIAAEAARDDAIRTKALIGSKREATAMATASAAKRESEKLRDELGHNARHATVLAVEAATGEKYDWLDLRRWCKKHGVTAATVPDKRFGEVKAWPSSAWMDCYGVSLHLLFAPAFFGEVSA